MEIQEIITKEVFEQHIPAAKMPERNDSVYNRLKAQFVPVYKQVCQMLVGESIVARAEENETLKQLIVRQVCLLTFFTGIRSLDLVLTSTGFGVVSTNSMAPASKVRVDALVDEIRLQAAFTTSAAVKLLIGIEGWGATRAAQGIINTLFWDINLLKQHTTLQVTADNWTEAQGVAAAADAFLRKVVSDEYMEELLEKTRCGQLENSDIIIVDKCNRFTGQFISGYKLDRRPNKMLLDGIMKHLERYQEQYPTYVQSETYKAGHAERYKNKKEDATFFFM